MIVVLVVAGGTLLAGVVIGAVLVARGVDGIVHGLFEANRELGLDEHLIELASAHPRREETV